MPVKTERTTLTPPQLARRWGVSTNKVLYFIGTGELRALNLARAKSGRPRYVIDMASVEAFEHARTVRPDQGDESELPRKGAEV